jgi:hypothetical protein
MSTLITSISISNERKTPETSHGPSWQVTYIICKNSLFSQTLLPVWMLLTIAKKSIQTSDVSKQIQKE